MGWQSHLQKTITKSNSPTHDMIHMWNNVKRTTTKFCQKIMRKIFPFETNSVCTICSENGNPQKLTVGFNYTTRFLKYFLQLLKHLVWCFQYFFFLRFIKSFSFLDLLNLFLLRFLKVDELMFGEFNTTRFLKYVSFLDKI